MSLPVDLYEAAKGQAFALLIGGAAAPRWFYGMAPQEALLPYVTVELRFQASTQHMGGKSAIEDPILEVEVWGEEPLATWSLAMQIDAWLDAFRGMLGGTNVRRIFRQTLTDDPQLRSAGAERQTFRVRGAWRVVYAP